MSREREIRIVALAIIAAFALWYFAFQTEIWNFWLRLSLAAAILATSALILTPDRTKLFQVRSRDIVIGIVSALVLYAIFWVGKQIATAIFPFAADQIQNVYANREQLDLIYIGLLLFFLVGPSEEIFWRGFVQPRLRLDKLRLTFIFASQWAGEGEQSRRSLARRSLVVTTALYALVHIWTLNLILIIAAAVVGLCWGWLYQRERSLIAVMLSHASWDVLIFVLLPLV